MLRLELFGDVGLAVAGVVVEEGVIGGGDGAVR